MLSRKLFLVFLTVFIFNLGLNPHVVYGEISPYKSAGWVDSDGSPQYTNLGNCQQTDDRYCSRIGNTSNGANLYFSSFPDMDSFGIPLNSVINKIKIRIKGKSTNTHLVALEPKHNNIILASSCQKPPDLIKFYLGSAGDTVELSFPLTNVNGLLSCLSQNNINFRNLTFRISQFDFATWSADIDNFEIAFDYTPPSVAPIDVNFPPNQNGSVWEIGPYKSNLNSIPDFENFYSVAVGEQYNLGLKKDGTLWIWQTGNAQIKQMKGENGLGFLIDVKKIIAGGNYGMAIKEDGTAWYWSQGVGGISNPVQVKYAGNTLQNITDIAIGDGHFLVLKSDGTIYGWGLNNHGQVGIGCSGGNCSSVINPQLINNFEDVVQITAGSNHSLALKNDGSVWGWGRVSEGQLGASAVTTGNKASPIRIIEISNIKSISAKSNHSMSLTNDGRIYTWGGFSNFESLKFPPKLIPGLGEVKSISSGGQPYSPGVIGHVIKKDGTLWQLYINDIPAKQVPILKDVVAVASGNKTPALAVVNTTGDVLGDSTVKPFMSLPWDYKKPTEVGKIFTFSEAALAINSYFDHQYPLLGVGLDLDETPDATDSAVPFMGFPQKRIPELWYSSHDGYDYGTDANVHDGDPVYPTASGSASYEYDKAGGHTILVDHLNGFQTRYYHLKGIGLITKQSNEKVSVSRDTIIGKVGSTGSHTTGSHIHMGVFQDKNNDGNFEDNEPDGATDPFGWMPFSDPTEKMPDPWENYSFFYKGQERKGNKSNYLWTEKIAGLKEVLTNTGGEHVVENYTLNFPPDLLLDGLLLDAQLEPGVNANDTLFAIGPGIRITLKDSFKKNITNLNKPLKLTIAITDEDLEKFKANSIAVYSSNDLKIWVKEKSILDVLNGRITVSIDHLTHFAVMGERIDTQAPSTSLALKGSEGERSYFRSDVELILDAEDNENGRGIENTHFKTDKTDWDTYSLPVIFNDEGIYKIYYYSVDKDRNVEDVNASEFTIDKTSPKTEARVSGKVGEDSWYISDVKIKLTSTDSGSGVSKIEYSLDHGSTYQQYDNEIHISEDGISEINYRSVDKAGNIEEAHSASIVIDKTPPSSVVYTSGQRGQNNWYRSSVSVALNGNDSTSGYKTSYFSLDNGSTYAEYTDPIILSDEGIHKIYYYAVDNAGNKEDEEIVEINIDETAPVLSIRANPSRIWPPDGKMVDVKVTGNVIEENLLGIAFNVIDEYGILKPVLTDFNQIIRLEAKRNGNDLNGRLYQIQVTGEDMAGNNSSSDTRVTVPHSQ